MKKNLILLFALCCLSETQAQGAYRDANASESRNEWKEGRNRVHLNASLLTHDIGVGYAVEVGYTRFLGKLVGVSGGLFMQSFRSDFLPQWEVTDRQGKVFRLDEEDENFPRLGVHLGPRFRLPLFTFGRDKDHTLAWECMPAVAFTVPNRSFLYLHKVSTDGRMGYYETKRVRSHDGQWYYGLLRNELALKNDAFTLSLGYTFSTLNPYSQCSRVLFDGKDVCASVPGKKATHEISVSLGYSF